jgi:putative transposase
MRQLAVDGGLEFYSRSLEQVCLSLNIEWVAAPRRTAWFKGRIERFLGTMNRAVAHGVPGTTFSDIFEKGDYDPAKHAVISISQLKEYLHKWIADVYHQQVHRSLQTSPAKMWTSSIQLEDIRLPDESTRLDAVMGRLYQDRRLSHKGIEFEGLFYNSSELTGLRMAEGTNLNVDLRVDESNLGWIHVIEPRSRTEYRVPALNLEYASGVSLWLHKVLKNRQKRRGLPDQSPTGWLDAKAEIQDAIAAELKLKRRRTNKRRGRFEEALGSARSEAPAVQSPQIRPVPAGEHTNHFEQFDNSDEVPVYPVCWMKMNPSKAAGQTLHAGKNVVLLLGLRGRTEPL